MMDELKPENLNPEASSGEDSAKVPPESDAAGENPGLKPSHSASVSPGLKPGASTLPSDGAQEESDISAEMSPEENPGKAPHLASQDMGHPGVETPGAAEASAPSASTSAPAKKNSVKADKDKKEDNAFPFSVTVGKVYDGPMDLLLDLIRKQDIDIYDIPIAKITAQFLAYVEQLKATDVDTAGEFIYTASLLIHIKSKMLLPRSPIETAEGEIDDPRRELVERLLEHERFKNAAEMLQQKRIIEENVWSNPQMKQFISEDDNPGLAVSLFDLIKAFGEVLERAKSRPVYEVNEEEISVSDMVAHVRALLYFSSLPRHSQRPLTTSPSRVSAASPTTNNTSACGPKISKKPSNPPQIPKSKPW